MVGRPKGSKTKEKPFKEALRMALADGGLDHRGLRRIADALIAKATSGDVVSIREIADRLDGKPSQEIEATIDDKRDATDWSRAELVAFLNNATDGGGGTSEEEGRGREPDSVH